MWDVIYGGGGEPSGSWFIYGMSYMVGVGGRQVAGLYVGCHIWRGGGPVRLLVYMWIVIYGGGGGPSGSWFICGMSYMLGLGGRQVVGLYMGCLICCGWRI